MFGKLSRMLSVRTAEAILETIIALAMAGGVSVSLVSLAVHLNEVRAVRSAGEASLAGNALAGGIVGLNAPPLTSNLD